MKSNLTNIGKIILSLAIGLTLVVFFINGWFGVSFNINTASTQVEKEKIDKVKTKAVADSSEFASLKEFRDNIEDNIKGELSKEKNWELINFFLQFFVFGAIAGAAFASGSNASNFVQFLLALVGITIFVYCNSHLNKMPLFPDGVANGRNIGLAILYTLSSVFPGLYAGRLS